MLYWLTALSDGGDVFNLFRYITFRAGGAFLTALISAVFAHPDPVLRARVRQRPANPQ
jgi:phospho-N-acetylmuramoyl-pentapeptide-transferase